MKPSLTASALATLSEKSRTASPAPATARSPWTIRPGPGLGPHADYTRDPGQGDSAPSTGACRAPLLRQALADTRFRPCDSRRTRAEQPAHPEGARPMPEV